MNDRCPDADVLVSVSVALGRDAEERIRHIAACEECRDWIRSLAILHEELTDEAPLPAEFTEQVVAQLRTEDPASTPSAVELPNRRTSGIMVGGVVFAFATVTIVAILNLLAKVGEIPMSSAADAVPTAVVGGALLAVYCSLREVRESGTDRPIAPIQ